MIQYNLEMSTSKKRKIKKTTYKPTETASNDKLFNMYLMGKKKR